MTFHIVTLFPDAFTSYLSESILKRAIADKKISVHFYNPRDYAEVMPVKPNRPHLKARIDNKPYGGGPGMVIEALPVIKAIEKAVAATHIESVSGKASTKKVTPKIIWLSPSGTQFDTAMAKKIAGTSTVPAKKSAAHAKSTAKNIIIICGRYEGIDARVKKVFKTTEISVGPFVLTGGELPAMIMIDCIARQVEGVLGSFDSLEESRISSPDVYTRPEVLVYKGKSFKVPKILLSGHQKKIEEWKLAQGKTKRVKVEKTTKKTVDNK